jgi:hypothetical protein
MHWNIVDGHRELPSLLQLRVLLLSSVKPIVLLFHELLLILQRYIHFKLHLQKIVSSVIRVDGPRNKLLLLLLLLSLQIQTSGHIFYVPLKRERLLSLDGERPKPPALPLHMCTHWHSSSAAARTKENGTRHGLDATLQQAAAAPAGGPMSHPPEAERRSL